MSDTLELLTSIPVHTQMEPGQQFAKTPPHITILPWATIDSDHWPIIDQKLAQDVSPTNLEYYPLVAAAYTDQFGLEEDEPVKRLVSIDFFAVHAMVQVLFTRHYAEFDTTHTGANGWHGHITLTDREYERWEEIPCNELVVAQKVSSELKRVQSVYHWREPSNATTS